MLALITVNTNMTCLRNDRKKKKCYHHDSTPYSIIIFRSVIPSYHRLLITEQSCFVFIYASIYNQASQGQLSCLTCPRPFLRETTL